MKFSYDEKPGAHLEGPGRALLHLHHRDDRVLRAARLRGDLDGLEEAERVHALLRLAEPGAAVELALVDAQLAPDDLVARLVVADDVDALEADLLAGLDVVGEVERPRRRGRSS